MTVEANPETVTPELAALLRAGGVTRVSLGAQSFTSRLLGVLERTAQPRDVRRAFYALRDVGFDNISLDLIYGIPGQSPADLDRDLDEALELGPDHLSCYELEAKPGTRFTRTFGDELTRQAEAMEGYFEQVVERADGSRLPVVRDGQLLPDGSAGRAPDFRSRHNLAYWLGRDYLGLGVGAVSTLGSTRRRNPGAPALHGRARSGRAAATRARGARRGDAPARADHARPAARRAACAGGPRRRGRRRRARRLERLGLAAVTGRSPARTLELTTRGRFLGGGVTAELLA